MRITAASATCGATKEPTQHGRNIFRSRLGSGLRMALACIIVGCITIYGPETVRRQVEFPAFSYVTAVLIAGEATVGDCLRGSVHALYGTILAMLPAIWSLKVVGHRSFSLTTTTLAVTFGSFVVTLPESTHLITKRVALAQIVLVYVAAFREGKVAGPLSHPVHAAASTAVGVVAAVLSLLLPFPHLACLEVKEKSELFTKISLEKLKLLLGAFCALDKTSAVASITQAQSMSTEAAKLLQSIRMKQGGVQWERPQISFFSTEFRSPTDRLEAIRIPLKGMEMALSSTSSFPVKKLNQDFKNILYKMEDDINLTLNKLKPSTATDEVPKRDHIHEELMLTQSINAIVSGETDDLAFLFFQFCMRLLYNELVCIKTANSILEKRPCHGKDQVKKKRKFPFAWTITISGEMFKVALKCSISMGLAVLLGILFDKENGHWSGLTVAMAITTWRESTFKMANLRIQGTALGSVYGVLCSLISQNLMELRFCALLPWIIFTSFMRHSRMYGETGATAAAISALIILGRKYYGPSNVFAIQRLTETFIGLSCAILVEITLQPTRAPSLARSQLSRTAGFLNEHLESLLVVSTTAKVDRTAATTSSFLDVREMGKKVFSHINELQKLITEAEAEPNFWFRPLLASCYHKLSETLNKMEELVIFLTHGLHFLEQELDGAAINGIVEPLKLITNSTKCFADILQIKSLRKLDKEMRRRTSPLEVEAGNAPVASVHQTIGIDEEECDKALALFLQNAEELMSQIGDEEEQNRTTIVLCLGSIGFCIRTLMTETWEMEKRVLQLLQWENPTKHINLYEICSKVRSVPAF